jgi:uncharacterized protein YbgA (DUF1722 family)
MERVKVFAENRPAVRNGVGLFAAALKRRMPTLPVEEEGRLTDSALRDNFIERVFAYDRLRSLFDGSWSYAALVEFHTRHKLALLAHSTTAYQELGRLVADGRRRTPDRLAREYEAGFMTALAKPATRARHTNVLMHMAGHFKRLLDAASRQELSASIHDYRAGRVPRLVPLTLIRHHARVHDVDYLRSQVYLSPGSSEQLLIGHV